jgi:hypothetical protein
MGISDRFASALIGTLFGFAFHLIKDRMEHALRRVGLLDRGDFYDQESRSKHPMLFRVLPFAFIRICAKFRGRE